MTRWYELPPGPERRAAMLDAPMRPNISPNDYTPEEWARLQAQSAELVAAVDEMTERHR